MVIYPDSLFCYSSCLQWAFSGSIAAVDLNEIASLFSELDQQLEANEWAGCKLLLSDNMNFFPTYA